MIQFNRFELAYWDNPHRLSKSDQAELAALVRANATPERIQEFVSGVSSAVNDWEHGIPLLKPDKKVVDHIERVESESRRLMSALRSFAGEPFLNVSRHFSYLVFAENPPPPVKLPPSYRHRRFEDVCAELVERIEVVQVSCKYARAKIQLDRASKSSLNRARSLVANVVRIYSGHFGSLPACGKADWFPEFMERLGQIVNHKGKIGRALVAAVVDRMNGTRKS